MEVGDWCSCFAAVEADVVFIYFAFSAVVVAWGNLRNNLTLNKSANLINLWAFCGCRATCGQLPTTSAQKYAVHVIAFCCCCCCYCCAFPPGLVCCWTCILVNLTLLNYAQCLLGGWWARLRLVRVQVQLCGLCHLQISFLTNKTTMQ